MADEPHTVAASVGGFNRISSAKESFHIKRIQTWIADAGKNIYLYCTLMALMLLLEFKKNKRDFGYVHPSKQKPQVTVYR